MKKDITDHEPYALSSKLLIPLELARKPKYIYLIQIHKPPQYSEECSKMSTSKKSTKVY